MLRAAPPTGFRLHRRRLLGHGLALAGAALLPGCGGGGGGGGTPAPPAGGGGAPAAGRLLFANSSTAAVADLGRGSVVEFDPGDSSVLGSGVTVSPQGEVAIVQEETNAEIRFATFDLAGTPRVRYVLPRELAFITSAVMFDASGTRAAFSLNELDAPSGQRVDRVLVLEWPSGRVIARFDGWEEPVWAGTTGELVLRDPDSKRLRLLGTQWQDLGWLADVATLPGNSRHSFSADGRYLLLEDGPRVQAYDRATGTRWVAAQRISDLHAPTFSPDGRRFAVHAIDLTTATRDFFTYVPHLLPFAPGQTVEVTAETPKVDRSIVFTGDRMAWIA